MSEIFGVDIAGIVYGAMSGQLHAVTLHKASETLDKYGAPTRTFVDHAGQGVRLRWNATVAMQRGYPADAVKILILQSDTPAPTIADEISVGGERWRIIDVTRDPVDATWVMAGVRA